MVFTQSFFHQFGHAGAALVPGPAPFHLGNRIGHHAGSGSHIELAVP